jgi:hypothetical protein
VPGLYLWGFPVKDKDYQLTIATELSLKYKNRVLQVLKYIFPLKILRMTTSCLENLKLSGDLLCAAAAATWGALTFLLEEVCIEDRAFDSKYAGMIFIPLVHMQGFQDSLRSTSSCFLPEPFCCEPLQVFKALRGSFYDLFGKAPENASQ